MAERVSGESRIIDFVMALAGTGGVFHINHGRWRVSAPRGVDVRDFEERVLVSAPAPTTSRTSQEESNGR